MEGMDSNRMKPEPPATTAEVGDDKEAATECSPNGVEVGVLVYKKGAWSKEEDEKLRRAVQEYGVRNWVTIEKFSGLARPAKNCRLRWLNYLRPNLKKHPITQEEEKLILHLHSKYGNSWSRIASKLPGRSDNEIKNFWHKRAKKCQKQHFPNYHIKDEHNPNTPRDASSMIHSPQTLISTSQQLELTHKTIPSPNTPTSGNFYLSPHQRSQSSSGYFFTPLVEPPILSSPQGRFKRFSTPQNQLSASASASGLPCPAPNASLVFRPQHSSLQMQRPPHMESPTSPLQLKLSSGVSQQTIGSPGPLLSPASPLKLCLSSTESNLSNIPLNMLTPAVQLASPIEPMGIDSEKVDGQDSPFKTKPPLVQFDMLETGKTSSSIHEVGSETNLEIMEELREAQAKVKFLKKKLIKKGISKKLYLHKLSVRKADFFNENPVSTNLYGRESETKVSLDEYSSQMTTKEFLSTTSPRTKDSKIGADIIIENRLSELREIDNFDDKSCTQESIVPKKVTTYEEAYVQILESLRGGEDSINLVDHLNSQNTMNGLNSDSWDNNLCPVQGPTIGKFLNGWSTLEGLFIESSTPLRDSYFTEDLVGQRSGIEQSLTDGCDRSGSLCYLQSDESGYFGDNFGQKDASFMDGNLATSISSEINLLSHHCPTTDLQEHSYLVSELMMEHESSFLPSQCSTANLLDSSYLVSKQIMGQESQQGEQFSFQTSKGGNLVETSELCQSVFLSDHYPASNMMDTKCLVGFDKKLPIGEQYAVQTSRQDRSREESLMEGFLVENLWPEGQMVSQDQTVLPNQEHDGEHDHMNSSIHQLEWCNNCNTIPDEFDKGLCLHIPSTTQPLLTIADYI